MACLLAALLCASRVVITEVMANPAGGSGVGYPEDRNEFIELHNPTRHAVDLFNWALDDGDARDYICPWADSSLLLDNPTLQLGHTWLRPGGYAVVLDSEYTSLDPQGGHIRPWRFADSTLVLTVRNTTLGNGLANNDPVWLISPYGDTSTFGTPLDNSDSLPCDAGDGVSWERIDPLGPDTVSNWTICLDSAGATPGRPASLLALDDFAVTELALLDTAPLQKGTAAAARARIANQGRQASAAWEMLAWLDLDGNGSQDPAERVVSVPGFSLAPGSDTALEFRFACPNRATDLWVEVAAPAECDPADNRRRITVAPGMGRLLELVRARFTPDRDRFEDSLEVLWHLPEPGGRLKVSVFDLRGRVVARLFDGRAARADDAAYWDGNRLDGGPAPAGIYAVTLSYSFSGRKVEARLPAVLVRR